MKIFVTGDRGYIGTVLTEILLSKGYDVIGYDIGYYSDCCLCHIKQQYQLVEKDIRDIQQDDLYGIDAVIHLAGLSNDPLGELDPRLTEDINYYGTIELAQKACLAGVKRFVYSSSQSMYGISETDEELDEEKSKKTPLTVYARTKWEAEKEIRKMTTNDFTVVAFRPSTVFGESGRLRCDIVFNNLVACAFTTGRIEIKSDGTPWRPVIHVRDVCSALIAGLEAPSELVAGKAYNIGISNGNYTVRQLAEAAQNAMPGCELVFTGEHGSDSRTYKVSFARILSELSDYYHPEWDLERGARELVEFFRSCDLKEVQFRGRQCNRLLQIKYLRNIGILDENLRRIKK